MKLLTPRPEPRFTDYTFMEDEDGELLFLDGHQKSTVVRLAVFFHLQGDWGLSVDEAAQRSSRCRIDFIWLRWKHDYDEYAKPCRRWQRGAFRQTVIHVWKDAK